MLATLAVVLPIFALVGIGWAARRAGLLGEQATAELNRFVAYLALPALLFDVVVHARLAEIWRPDFVAVFTLSSLAVFAATVIVRRRTRSLADAAIDGLNAGYANTGFMGFPLALAAFGPAALAPTLLATVITVCVVFGLALGLIEAALQGGQGRGRLALKVAGRLARNPLVFAPALALVVPLTGASVPAPLETVLRLLGGAAAPCALVTLGLFLGERRRWAGVVSGQVLFLAGLKILVQPAVAWALATQVFHLPPLLAHVAVLLAALPTGTGPFMLAQLYRREAAVTSGVILVSTALSLVTVTAYLALAV